MSETETKQIVGKCSEISEKNGWTKFSVDVGSQYPVGLSTKLPALIEQARAVGQDIATWTFKESQGGENPNKPGTFYTNRYLEKAEIGSSVDDGAVGMRVDAGTTTGTYGRGSTVSGNAPIQQAPATPPVDWDAKERRDYRSRAWAQTLAAFTHTIKVDESVEDVFARLQPFQRKVFTDVCQSFAYPVVDEDENLPFG